MTTSALAPACRVHHPANRPPEFDCRDVYAICGLVLHERARSVAYELGPSIFPDGPVRRLGVTIVTGKPYPRRMDGVIAAADWRLADEVARCELEPDEAWAVSLVRQMATERYREVLADQLVWAAERIRAGDPIRVIRQHVGHAFKVADGMVPLFAGEPWEVAA